MNSKLKYGLLALFVSAMPGPLAAADNLSVLANASGLSDRNVRMLLGPARTPYVEHRIIFHRVERKFIETFGVETYRDLMVGKPVRFEREIDGKRVTFIVQLEPNT